MIFKIKKLYFTQLGGNDSIEPLKFDKIITPQHGTPPLSHSTGQRNTDQIIIAKTVQLKRSYALIDASDHLIYRFLIDIRSISGQSSTI